MTQEEVELAALCLLLAAVSFIYQYALYRHTEKELTRLEKTLEVTKILLKEAVTQKKEAEQLVKKAIQIIETTKGSRKGDNNGKNS